MKPNHATKPLSAYKRGGLNFANGFLTEDLELVPHDPDLGMTYTLPYLYEPDKAEHCPQFLQMLEDAWGADPDYIEKVQAIREAIGATLMGIGPRFQQAVTLFGTGNSGKSKILEIIAGLLPPEAVSYLSPGDFADTFKPVMLVGSMMNICGEMSETRAIVGDKFKLIICGEPISVQYKGRDSFNINPKATHWFATNHLPQTKDTSDGFTRRWLFLEFTRKVASHRMVREIVKDVLANERSAIAAWAVQAVPTLVGRQKFLSPASHEAIVDDLANDLNIVRFFLKKSGACKFGEHELVTERALHDEFWAFSMQTEGVRPPGVKTFQKLMKGLQVELGFRMEIERDSWRGVAQTVYQGVGLAK